MLHGRGMAPPMLGNDQRKTLNRLVKRSGKKFDREYMEQVALKHQRRTCSRTRRRYAPCAIRS